MVTHGVPLDGSVFAVKYQGPAVRRGKIAFIRGGRFICRFRGYSDSGRWMRFEFAPTSPRLHGTETARVTYPHIWAFLRDWTVTSDGGKRDRRPRCVSAQ